MMGSSSAWRSSDTFIITSMSLALFTDELLFAFMVPLLPHMFEQRMGFDPSLTQRYTSIFLAEGAFVSIVSSPFVGSIADKTRSKKNLLLFLLGLALVSVLCLSWTPSLLWVFVGRFFQCLASNGLWIVGMATMADNIGSGNMGKLTGLTATLTAGGTCAGPVMAGFLFGLGGYWTAWSGALVFLFVDIIMRLLMVEKKEAHKNPDEGNESGEQDPLLNDTGRENPVAEEKQGWRFYAVLFRDSRFTAGIVCYFLFAVFIASFECTLAVHVRDTFGWGVFHVGLLMASIQGPGIVLGPLVGYMKDRIGSRIPTMIGFLSLAPFLFLVGVPGNEAMPWANVGIRGKVIYATCMTIIGCLTSLLDGVGMMEATETVDKLETKHPGIFGPHGGYCRALAVTNMSLMSGLLTGPVLSGWVVEQYGYFQLQCILAILSFLGGIYAAFYLSRTSKREVDEQT